MFRGIFRGVFILLIVIALLFPILVLAANFAVIP